MQEAGEDQAEGAREFAPAGVRRFPFLPPRATTALRFRLAAFRARIAAAFEREMEAGRGFLFLPVLFGIGIVLYFALPREPALVATLALPLATAAAAWAMRRHIGALRLLAALTAVACGLAAMKLRTDAVAAPVFTEERTVTLTGWIADREASGKSGARIYVRVAAIAGLAQADTPRTVRVTVRSRANELHVGDAISVLARLQPGSPPVMPGAFDFFRSAFYDGIGAVGFSYGAAKPADLGPAPLDIRLVRPLARLRETIRIRVEEALPGNPGRIAASLIMGDQRGIEDSTQEDMRASGLGHILSISGLHMALVAGAAFWLLRALLALSAGLALRRPIKKWAAAGALGVATFYLGISGAEVATVRSWVMLAVMLVAVLFDRRAITLRNVALAALLILIFEPESLLSASFQMSFSATVALIAGYEALAERAARRLALAEPRDRGIAGRIGRSVSGLFVTSLLAGFATAPFGIYHFQRLAPLSLIANVAAAPAVGFVIMPMAFAAVVLMPFGLESLPLAVLDYGLDWMLFVARRAAEWSEGIGGVSAPPAATLVLFVAGFLWLALWQERWRLAGLLPVATSVLVAMVAPKPDIIVTERGTAMAVRADDGRFRILGGRTAKFEIGNWLRADGDPREAGDPSLGEGVTCASASCAGRFSGLRVAIVFYPREFDEACRSADVVVSRLTAPRPCRDRATVVDRPLLDRGGSVSLYRGEAGRGFRIETAYPEIRRPFMPPVTRR